MTLIFNLDLDDLTKVTDYGYDRKKHPFPTFYFRLYQNGYDVDMSKFNRLRLRVNDTSGNSNTIDFTKVVTINGEKLVEVKLDDKYLGKNDTLTIVPTVTYSNKSITLSQFKLVIYEGAKTEMNMIKQAIERFNHMYNLYIKAIKRDQFNKPNGVIGLDSDGKIDRNRLPDNIGKHVEEKIFNTEVHGMTLNDEFMLIYYDKVDKKYYEVNSLNGGEFTYPNKPEKYNVFGGFFTDKDVDLDKNIVHGGKWNEYI